MQKHIHILQLLILAIFGITAVAFFPFTAEDAFITYRYAANFATLGSLVFNGGEPIMALTSPLHGMVASRDRNFKRHFRRLGERVYR